MQSGRTGMNVPEGHHTVWRRKAVCAIGSPTYDVRYTKVNVLSEFSTRNKSPKCNTRPPRVIVFTEQLVINLFYVAGGFYIYVSRNQNIFRGCGNCRIMGDFRMAVVERGDTSW